MSIARNQHIWRMQRSRWGSCDGTPLSGQVPSQRKTWVSARGKAQMELPSWRFLYPQWCSWWSPVETDWQVMREEPYKAPGKAALEVRLRPAGREGAAAGEWIQKNLRFKQLLTHTGEQDKACAEGDSHYIGYTSAISLAKLVAN